ncbi:hypothetical protein F2P79_024760 [Pimephales promelas]|nr:hypothetical protein F2P79_024760 [Pimephales promelas]
MLQLSAVSHVQLESVEVTTQKVAIRPHSPEPEPIRQSMKPQSVTERQIALPSLSRAGSSSRPTPLSKPSPSQRIGRLRSPRATGNIIRMEEADGWHERPRGGLQVREGQGLPPYSFVNQQQRMIMDSNRALWQAAKLEMKGKVIVLDLTEVTVCRGVCGRDG